ncbi:MAG: hypothetical protein R2911_25400 [Caldilineaceae bacterium]
MRSFPTESSVIFAQDQDPTPAENSAPAIGKLTHLYEGWRETGASNTQSLAYITLPFVNPKSIQSFADGVTTLDTTADQSESAGYFSTSSKGWIERRAMACALPCRWSRRATSAPTAPALACWC